MQDLTYLITFLPACYALMQCIAVSVFHIYILFKDFCQSSSLAEFMVWVLLFWFGGGGGVLVCSLFVGFWFCFFLTAYFLVLFLLLFSQCSVYPLTCIWEFQISMQKRVTYAGIPQKYLNCFYFLQPPQGKRIGIWFSTVYLLRQASSVHTKASVHVELILWLPSTCMALDATIIVTQISYIPLQQSIRKATKKKKTCWLMYSIPT